MAAYSVSLSKHATLTAGAEDVVTFTADYRAVEVKNRATSGGGIFVRVDGTPVVASADNTFIVLPGESLVLPSGASQDSVRLISATADAYSVTGVPLQ